MKSCLTHSVYHW